MQTISLACALKRVPGRLVVEPELDSQLNPASAERTVQAPKVNLEVAREGVLNKRTFSIGFSQCSLFGKN